MNLIIMFMLMLIFILSVVKSISNTKTLINRLAKRQRHSKSIVDVCELLDRYHCETYIGPYYEKKMSFDTWKHHFYHFSRFICRSFE